MKTIRLFVVCGLFTTPIVEAADSTDFLLEGWDASATATLATDYIFRGISQTQNHPAIQGSIDVNHESGFYAGIWASNIESFDASGHNIEIDVYTGWADETDFGGFLPSALGWDIGILRYEFPSNSGADTTELYGGLSYSPLDWVTLSYYYYYGLHLDNPELGNYHDLSINTELPDWLWNMTLGLHAGHYDMEHGADDYTDWKVSLSKQLAGFTFEGAWTDTDANAGRVTDDHFVFLVSRTLGDPAPSESLPDGFDASANVTLATDYIYRGISQTGNDPAIQGSFDISHESGLYAGVWASNVDLDGSAGNNNIELDFYTGISGETGFGLGWDFGWLRYQYPDFSSINFNELYAGLSYSPLEILDLGFTYYHGLKIEHHHPGQYYDASVDIRVFDWVSDASSVGAFVKDLNLGVHYGYYNLNRKFVPGTADPDYSDWKVGVSKDIGAFNFEVAYTDTDLNSSSSTDDGRALLTVSVDL